MKEKFFINNQKYFHSFLNYYYLSTIKFGLIDNMLINLVEKNVIKQQKNILSDPAKVISIVNVAHPGTREPRK